MNLIDNANSRKYRLHIRMNHTPNRHQELRTPKHLIDIPNTDSSLKKENKKKERERERERKTQRERKGERERKRKRKRE